MVDFDFGYSTLCPIDENLAERAEELGKMHGAKVNTTQVREVMGHPVSQLSSLHNAGNEVFIDNDENQTSTEKCPNNSLAFRDWLSHSKGTFCQMSGWQFNRLF